MSNEIKKQLIEKLTKRFSNVAALAAAINELNTMQEYPEYLENINEDIFTWCEKRGKIWE